MNQNNFPCVFSCVLFFILVTPFTLILSNIPLTELRNIFFFHMLIFYFLSHLPLQKHFETN